MPSFERDHHRRVGKVLEALDAARLRSLACWFGGGTSIALRCGEYRESVDIDFLTSRLDTYRELRQRLTGAQGIGAVVRPGMQLLQAREMRADRYGIRTLLDVEGTLVKFEIVHEGRIALDEAGPDDATVGVATLTSTDLTACKLLANSDRGADDSVYSRDLIDLAMLAPPRRVLEGALAKARGAYGDSVVADLARAVQRLGDRPGRLEDCMRALAITKPTRATLWRRIRALAHRVERLQARQAPASTAPTRGRI